MKIRWCLVFLGLAMAGITPRAAQADLLAWLAGDKVNTPEERIFLDSSKKLNHAAVNSNTVLSTDGRTGGAIDFGDGAGSNILFNTVKAQAFKSITDKQQITVAFWMAAEESAVAPRDQSVFWLQSPGNSGGDRGFQAHIPWSNGNVYWDVGGCCSGTQRINGPIDREFWDSATGEEWTHWAFTLDEDGGAGIYINGEEVLFRNGPTDAVLPITKLWFGSAVDGGNSFAGRLDDIVIADNGLDADGIAKLFKDGPAAVWPNDVVAGGPALFQPAVPVIPEVVVNGQFIVPSTVVDGITTAKIDTFPQYVLDIDGSLHDADHIIVQNDTNAPNVKLDLTNAFIKVQTTGTFVPGEDFVLFFADEVIGIDKIRWDFPDQGKFDLSKMNKAGGYRLKYVGTPTNLAGDCNGDGTIDKSDLACACGTGQRAEVMAKLGIVDGDLDADGNVGFQDFLALSNNFGQTDANYTNGDIDCDGSVTFQDFLALSANYGQSSSSTLSAVPEPSSFGLLAVVGGMLGVIRRRRQMES